MEHQIGDRYILSARSTEKNKTIFHSSRRLQSVKGDGPNITHIQSGMACASVVVEVMGAMGAQSHQQLN